MTYWRNSWLEILIYILQNPQSKLSQISSSLPLRRCLNLIQSQFQAIICRRLVPIVNSNLPSQILYRNKSAKKFSFTNPLPKKNSNCFTQIFYRNKPSKKFFFQILYREKLDIFPKNEKRRENNLFQSTGFWGVSIFTQDMLASIFNVRGQIGKRPTFETMSLWRFRVESQLSEADDRFKFLGVFMYHRKSNYGNAFFS